MNDDVIAMLGKEEPKLEEKKTSPVETDKIDKDVFSSMLTADGKDGNFSTEKKEEASEEDKPDVDIKPGKVKEQLGKYADEFVANVMKHPDEYFVETSRGTLTIKDAIMEGWDPKTGEFNEAKSINKMKENELGKLSASDREAVESIMDPGNAGFAAADAESLGLDPNSPMIAQPPQAMAAGATPEQMPAAPPQEGAPAMDPNALASLLGGNM